jgi:hypothetical protein
MNYIDKDVNRENINNKIQLLKDLVFDLQSDLNDQTDLKTQLSFYKSILPIRLRINHFQNKLDRWNDATG